MKNFNYNDILNIPFNRLTPISIDHIKTIINSNGKIENKYYYLCKCKCGNTKVIERNMIKLGLIQSCGCLAIEKQKNSLLNIICIKQDFIIYGQE